MASMPVQLNFKCYLIFIYLNSYFVLAGVAQWIECQPANQRVTGSIPSQGTCVGCRPGPNVGGT